MKDQLESLIRTLLKIAGTLFASYGWFSDGLWADVTGAVLLLFGVIWSWRVHRPV